jgi:hypothetical protein
VSLTARLASILLLYHDGVKLQKVLTEIAAALRAAANRRSPLGAADVRSVAWLPALRMLLMVPPATQVAVHSL